MKQFIILVAAIAMIGFMSSESQAQHYRHGNHIHRGNQIHRGYGNFGNVYRGSGFNISIGNGFNGISYSSGRPIYGGGYYGGYGGYGNVYSRPVYRSNYYGGRGYYGGGYYGGGGYRGCGW